MSTQICRCNRCKGRDISIPEATQEGLPSAEQLRATYELSPLLFITGFSVLEAVASRLVDISFSTIRYAYSSNGEVLLRANERSSGGICYTARRILPSP